MARRVLSLNGTAWHLGQAEHVPGRIAAEGSLLERVAEWYPASVPGCVQSDLARAGILPDAHFGLQARAYGRAEESDWWLARDLPLSLRAGERAHLVLRGIDYIHDLFLNGVHLGRHEGMFSARVHDVTDLLRSDNTLAVRIVGSRWLPEDRSTAWEKLLNHAETRLAGLPGFCPHRRDTLKSQMAFGWDLAPPLLTMGIWDDVCLVVSTVVYLRDVALRFRPAPEGPAASVSVQVDSHQSSHVRLRCSLTGATFDSPLAVGEAQVRLEPGTTTCRVAIPVEAARLWWPWDQGIPDLYRICVEAWQEGELLDSIEQVVGLREVALDGWPLHVNGRPVYLRGANWVPASLFPGTLTESDYQALLSLARDANINLLRVWGGGLREKAAFYDLCDRLGILVWQEFPLACAFLTRLPQSRPYLSLVDAEARAIVRDLRNHPSLALWCGGNEFRPGRNRRVVACLQQVVASEDPDRPFLPASPWRGDHHNWQVWHHFQPPSAYRTDTAALVSEFGLQSPPAVEDLRSFIPAEELWPPGPSWAFHGAGLEKLWRYARPHLRQAEHGRPVASHRPDWSAVSLEGFVGASQRAHAAALQIAIEHYRRRKAAGCGGCVVWQLNEPWPAVSWALLAHDLRPKPAYAAVRRLFSPVLVSLVYPLKPYRAGDSLEAVVWIISDEPQERPGCRLEVVLRDAAGRACQQLVETVGVPPRSAAPVAGVHWRLPPEGPCTLECRLLLAGQTLSENTYDLAVHDDISPTLRQRIVAWLGRLLLPN